MTTGFEGVFLMKAPVNRDSRGSFERVWSADIAAQAGLPIAFAQASLARNEKRGTIRGLHFAASPHEEIKYLRCTAGSLFDVVADVRPGSPTFGKYLSFELQAGDGLTLCIGAGFAHGYQTLEDQTNILYFIDTPYVADAARGIRYNDPAIAVAWPLPVTCVAERDATAPLLKTLF